MTKLASNPTKIPFNKSDVEQQVNSAFNQNRGIENISSVSLSKEILTIAFTNKNPNGSNQAIDIVLSSLDVAKFALNYLNKKIARHREVDRSHEGLGVTRKVLKPRNRLTADL